MRAAPALALLAVVGPLVACDEAEPPAVVDEEDELGELAPPARPRSDRARLTACQSIADEFRRAEAQARDDCERDADCGLFPRLSASADPLPGSAPPPAPSGKRGRGEAHCGGVARASDADVLRSLVERYRGAGCGGDVFAADRCDRARYAGAQCSDGRCRPREAED